MPAESVSLIGAYLREPQHVNDHLSIAYALRPLAH
jgi:hypothetical protein